MPLLEKLLTLRRSASKQSLVPATVSPSGPEVSIRDLTPEITSMQLYNGQFEATLPGHMVPRGATHFHKSGYTIEVEVNATPDSPHAPRAPPVFRGLIKLPIYLAVHTVTIDVVPGDGNFRIRAAIVNSRYANNNTVNTNIIETLAPDNGAAAMQSAATKLRRRHSFATFENLTSYKERLPPGPDTASSSDRDTISPDLTSVARTSQTKLRRSVSLTGAMFRRISTRRSSVSLPLCETTEQEDIASSM